MSRTIRPSKKPRFYLILIALLSPIHLSFANTPPTTQDASLSDMGPLCKGALVPQGDPANQSETQFQKTQYCQAAQSSISASKTENTMWKTWGAVATVCTAACTTSAVAAVSSSKRILCRGSLGAAGVAQGLATKEYLTALQSIAGAHMSAKMMGGALQGAAGKSTDTEACATAASSSFSAFTSHKNYKAETDMAKANLVSAKNLHDSPGPAFDSGGNLSSNPEGGAATEGEAPYSGSGFSGSGTAADIACDTASRTSNVTAVIQCATSHDPGLPDYVSTPQFADDFQKAAGGKPLSDFFATDDAPVPTLLDSMGANLNADEAAVLGAALMALEQGIDPSEESTYSSAGTSTAEGGKPLTENEAALGAMMANIMQKITPKDGDPGAQSFAGLKKVIEANQNNRAPAALAENKNLSLFDRVTYRYYFVVLKMDQPPKMHPGKRL